MISMFQRRLGLIFPPPNSKAVSNMYCIYISVLIIFWNASEIFTTFQNKMGHFMEYWDFENPLLLQLSHLLSLEPTFNSTNDPCIYFYACGSFLTSGMQLNIYPKQCLHILLSARNMFYFWNTTGHVVIYYSTQDISIIIKYFI